MYEVIVIGGGLLGLSVAYHLVREGVATLLVDRPEPGRATDAGAGIVSPETNIRDSDTWFEFAVEARAYYASLLAKMASDQSGDTGYTRCGLLMVAISEDEVESFEQAKTRILERQARWGVPASDDFVEISPGEARDLFPPLPPTVMRAAYYRQAARVDGRLLSDALRRASARHGLVFEEAHVEQLELDGDRATGIVANGRRFKGSKIVIAGGAWSGVFGDQLGIRIPVEPQRGQIVHLRFSNADTSPWPIVKGFHEHYIVPWPDGRVAVGATREPNTGYDPRVTAAGIHEVLSEALRVAPGLGDGEIHEIRVGLRPMSRDTLPILGAVPRIQGVFLATGHGPTGLQLGPFSGKIVADLVMECNQKVDLTPFLLSRFA